MSSFKAKASLIKAKLQQDFLKQNTHASCSQKQIKIVRQSCQNEQANQKILIQEPIIIEKKTVINSRPESSRKVKNLQSEKKLVKKEIQPFVPVVIPTRDRKMTVNQIQQKLTAPKKCQGGNKEIQIQIQKDDKNKDCLKKLFKKVHKLEDELKSSEAQRIRLKLELQNLQNIEKRQNDYEKKLNNLNCEKYKLEVEVDMLRKLLKDRDAQIQRHKSIVPKQIIKQVVVEKPVQVIIQVPKPVPGPQRIVQKIVQVPKYVQIEKKVPYEVQKQVIKTIQVPTVTQKVVYVDKPVYIDREIPVRHQVPIQVPVHVPVEVPIQKPVYIQRPAQVEEELIERLKRAEMEIQHLIRINSQLDQENLNLRHTCDQLAYNLETLRKHNQQKNREVQHLLQNSLDYNPCSPSQDYSLGSVKYTISSKNHPRAI